MDRGSRAPSRVARALGCQDNLDLNTHKVLAPQNPFAGSEWSSLGIEGGPWAWPRTPGRHCYACPACTRVMAARGLKAG